MKKTQAKTHAQCNVVCPYCDNDQNRFEDLKEHFNTEELRAEECDAQIACNYCEKTFIVDLIEF